MVRFGLARTGTRGSTWRRADRDVSRDIPQASCTVQVQGVD